MRSFYPECVLSIYNVFLQYRTCLSIQNVFSLYIERVLSVQNVSSPWRSLQNAFSLHRMCSLLTRPGESLEAEHSLQNVFSVSRMCSGSLKCVLSIQVSRVKRSMEFKSLQGPRALKSLQALSQDLAQRGGGGGGSMHHDSSYQTLAVLSPDLQRKEWLFQVSDSVPRRQFIVGLF